MGFEMQESELVSPNRRNLLGKLGITAGVLDAGMSSLATFLGGLVAANLLGDSELGVYAVFFTAFNFAQVVANNLVFVPAEVVAVAWPKETRMQSLAGAAAIGIAALVAAQTATASLVMPLAITTGLTTLLWPTQDHVRRMLHIADRSWAAAAVSTVQFSVMALSIGVLIFLDVDDGWIPFGALAIANAVSIFVGLILARPSGGIRPAPERLRLRSLTKSGGHGLCGGIHHLLRRRPRGPGLRRSGPHRSSPRDRAGHRPRLRDGSANHARRHRR